MQDDKPFYIFRNAIKTPDGTIIESFHRHDFKEYFDKVSLETYMVDGGHVYLRGSVNKVKAEKLHVTSEDDFHLVRETFTWGTYGINGDEELKRIKLKDMDTDHIKAIIEDGYCEVDHRLSFLMKNELELRVVTTPKS